MRRRKRKRGWGIYIRSWGLINSSNSDSRCEDEKFRRCEKEWGSFREGLGNAGRIIWLGVASAWYGEQLQTDEWAEGCHTYLIVQFLRDPINVKVEDDISILHIWTKSLLLGIAVHPFHGRYKHLPPRLPVQSDSPSCAYLRLLSSTSTLADEAIGSYLHFPTPSNTFRLPNKPALPPYDLPFPPQHHRRHRQHHRYKRE